MKRTTKWLGPQNYCDICKRDFADTEYGFFVDGRTIYGNWGLMCGECYAKYGTGLGLGKGQKYDVESKEKLEG